MGFVSWVVLVACAVGALLLARRSGSEAALAASAFLVVGFLVAFVSWFLMRLRAQEQVESLEIDELNRTGTGSAMFESADAALRPARRAREQFERYGVPVFTALLLLLQTGFAVVLWKGWLKVASSGGETLTTLVLTLFAIFGLGLFVLGNYAASLARLQKERLLRPAAGYLMLSAVMCFVVAGSEAGIWFGATRVDFWAGRAMQALLVIVALETLVTLVLEIYRPRIEGKPVALLYESRLISLVGQPEGIVRSMAHALDYQFGFKISETGFYRFVEENLAKLLLGQLAVLSLFTTFVIIEPGEQGLLERFGRPVAGREVLNPGMHFKFPWPMDTVSRYRTFALRELTVGSEPDEGEDDGHDHGHEDEMPVILWTVAHNHAEFNFIVASGAASSQAQQAEVVNLLTVGIPVQYEVTNLVQWARGHAEPERLLKQVSFRESVKLLASVDYDQVIADGRLAAASELRNRIQKRADELQLGVRMVFVGVNDVHPPVSVTESYERYVGAYQEKQTNILAALAWEDEKIPAARASAKQLVDEANAFKLARISDVVATSGQFTNQLAAYNASPDVYRQRRYLDALTRAIGPVRKYVLGTTNTVEQLQMNLEDKVRTDLLDLSVAPNEPRPNTP